MTPRREPRYAIVAEHAAVVQAVVAASVATAAVMIATPITWCRVSRSRKRTNAPTVAIAAKSEDRTAATAIESRAPTAYQSQPAISAAPVATT